MSNVTSQVLGKLVLFSAMTRIPGTECLAESSKKGGSRTHREVQKFLNPTQLSGLRAIKSEMFRLCRSYGTKIEVLDAWGVPVEDAELLTKRLEQMKARWDVIGDEILLNWDDWVINWANANPDYREEILRLAPKANAIQKKMKFVFASFRLTPEQIASGSLDGEFDSLHEQAAHEIAAQIRETYQDIDEPSAWDVKTFRTASVIGLLESVSRKARGLSFLSPRLAEIPAVIDALIKALPNTKTVDGLAAIGLRSVLEQLASSRSILERGIHLPGLGNQQLDLDAAEPLTESVSETPVLIDVAGAVEAPAVLEEPVLPAVIEETPQEKPQFSREVLDLLGPETPEETQPVTVEPTVVVESSVVEPTAEEVPAVPEIPRESPAESVISKVFESQGVDFCLPEVKAEPMTEAPILGYGW